MTSNTWGQVQNSEASYVFSTGFDQDTRMYVTTNRLEEDHQQESDACHALALIQNTRDKYQFFSRWGRNVEYLGSETEQHMGNASINAVQLFKMCHTSKKKCISDLARESSMEAMQVETRADGERTLDSTDVVSKVLAQSSCTNTFLKNAGISAVLHETEAERALRRELAFEKDIAASLAMEVDELKKKAEVVEEKMAKTEKEFQEYKKSLDQQGVLLQQFFRVIPGNSSDVAVDM